MDLLARWVAAASDVMWGPWMVALLFGTHLFLTLRLGFVQRFLGRGIRISLQRSSEGEGDISQFGALTTALAATIGTGNIIGVATAVALGGPGAVLWMWLTGVFGIATKYAEALLSVHYRVKMPDGSMAGGPMYVLERGLGQRWLGLLFAAFTAVAAFGIGNMVQANSIADMTSQNWSFPPGHVLGGTFLGVPLVRWFVGAVVTFFTALVILGGIKWIARVCEGFIPFMAIFYIIGCLILLALRPGTIPATLETIVTTAFTGQAAVGGFAGAGIMAAMRYGIARGLFSNESGLGSAPIVAAAAQTRDPVRQALVSSTGTFWDTVVVCALTGLVIVNGGKWQEGLSAAALTKATFDGIPGVGPVVLTIGLLTFVYSTILGWCYYGEKAIEYLFGTRAIRPYRLLWVVAVLVGSLNVPKLMWDFADTANACMALPNLVALFFLSGVAAKLTRQYLGPGAHDAPAPAPSSDPPAASGGTA
jgi:AGCS family alanine or glycine:cation symporter